MTTGKPIIEKLLEDPDQSILYRRIVRSERSNLRSAGVWHFHPDFEITYTLKSIGKRFVGYNISDYVENDFVLIGDSLPHCWITNQKTEQIVINFKKDLLGNVFWNMPEMKQIDQMLEKSKQGIFFDKVTSKKALTILLKMENDSGFNKLLNFFELLNLMANAKNQHLLTFYHHEIKDSLKASNRIEKIYSYILLHYQSNTISFSELSDELNMTKSSVCKFVKKVTKKSFSEIVIETRVNDACKLLSETDLFISEICFKCGFNNLSNFNRSFKRLMEVTPKEYRNIYSTSRKEN
jgi:AraC-like DNA-binding protein